MAAIRHAVPSLPYDYAALEPWVDELTMRIHHGGHHRTTVETLNAAEAQLALARRAGDFVLARYLQQRFALSAAEHTLHCLFWQSMAPNEGGAPRDDLADQISEDFGSFVGFKSEFSAAANSLESTGWAILAWQNERLGIVAAESHRLQTEWVNAAILVLDMSEHAYYLRYQNRRGEYAHNWWNTVNWPRAARRFAVVARAGIDGRSRRPTARRRVAGSEPLAAASYHRSRTDFPVEGLHLPPSPGSTPPFE
jgi:Fe-Mn family superoxide dismutase